MNPIKASLKYPTVTLILTAMVVFVGLHAFFKMPRTEDPTITIRTGLVAALLVLDLGVLNRRSHVLTFKEAMSWSLGLIAFALLVSTFAIASYLTLAHVRSIHDGLLQTKRYEDGVRVSLELSSAVRDQYAQYTIIDDIKINSQLTSGEDVADLGGTLLAYLAWKEDTKGQKLEPIDGLTPEQRFFVAYGQTGRQGQSPAPSADAVAAQKALITQYCVTCHSDKAKTAGKKASNAP